MGDDSYFYRLTLQTRSNEKARFNEPGFGIIKSGFRRFPLRKRLPLMNFVVLDLLTLLQSKSLVEQG